VTNRAPDRDSAIPISALQHYLFCARQCALIHIERIWTENVYTAEGRALHETADKPRAESRRGVRTVTAMPLSNAELGIVGVADVVEFHRREGGADRAWLSRRVQTWAAEASSRRRGSTLCASVVP
jgi:CRISPR-associated exonuclease Cas4